MDAGIPIRADSSRERVLNRTIAETFLHAKACEKENDLIELAVLYRKRKNIKLEKNIPKTFPCLGERSWAVKVSSNLVELRLTMWWRSCGARLRKSIKNKNQ